MSSARAREVCRASYILVLASLCAVFALQSVSAAEAWTVRVEEPTGLYPRTNEVVEVPYEKLGGKRGPWLVTDPQGKELPWQATERGVLFPATLIPGELPEYRVSATDSASTNFVNQVRLRVLGLNRVELGNPFFRILIDKQAAAIVEAFNLSAESHRTLNLVETTPEDSASWKKEGRTPGQRGFQPVPGVPEGNVGWTSLGGSGPITQVEVVEAGPLRGRVRLVREGESWELSWTAESRALRWQASRGFRFTAVSAIPFLPFDRFVGGSEYEWPTGPDEDEPPDHDVGVRQWAKLPGGHSVYYRNEENYGALGIVALDTNLDWTGIGSRRFVAQKPSGPSEIAITFPQWRGFNTVLQARREYRVLRQPLLITVNAAVGPGASITHPAERTVEPERETTSQAPEPFEPDAVSLDGDWELAWCEKGAGPPTNGWRTVKVPGSAHTQWLKPSKIYNEDAVWISS